VALGLVLAAAWAYGNSLGAVLVLDDIRAIVDNQTIRTLHPITTPLSPPTGTTVAGRPVGNLTFALNYAAAPAAVREAFDPGPAAVSPERASFERNILGYRLLNVAIHLAAALTLFGVLRRTFLTERVGERLATAAPWLAAAIALLWLVHPLQTSAVSYLVQRVESLMGLFYLLALYCAIRAGESLRRGAWSAAAIAASALGMATKEVMVTAPIAVAVWNWVFGGEEDRPRRWPLVGGLAATWLVLAALLAGEQRAPSIALGVTTTWQYLLTQSAVIAHYLRLVVWPSPLVFLYTWPLAQSAAEVIPQVLLIGALLGITAYGLRRRHPLAFAGVWFFLVLAPTSSVLPIVTEVAAEHRMYLPLAAVITCAVLALHTVAGRLTSGTGAADRRDRSGGLLLTCGAAVVLAVVLGTATRARNLDYSSAERLWGTTVAAQPDNPRAQVAYGEALARAGRLPAAEAAYTAALRVAPADVVALVRLGTVQAALGRHDDAVATLERAFAIDGNDPDARRALGRLYALRGEPARAVPHLEAVLAAYPNDVPVLNTLATVLADAPDAMVRNPARAVTLAERAVALTGRGDGGTLNLLAVALARAGRMPEAVSVTEEALRAARRQGEAALAADLERRLDILRDATGGRVGQR
jgi:tetratricopeptide (TPR) repeat protein